MDALSKKEIEKIDTISAERIREIVVNSLLSENELDDVKSGKKDYVGIVAISISGKSLVFIKDKIMKFKDEVKAYLNLLPDEFKDEKGGGYTFLNSVVDKNGNQWGGQASADELFCLGTALGLSKYIGSGLMLMAFPGHVPYVTVYQAEQKVEEVSVQEIYKKSIEK